MTKATGDQNAVPKAGSKPNIAVIDIGKTNVKLALVDPSDLSEFAVVTRPNTVVPGPPYPHFDVDGHWAFILEHLAQFHAVHGVGAIITTTHGACAALMDAQGALAAPIIDYEHTGPEELAAAYNAIRPPFSETGSPRLAMGLNIGAQLHYQFEILPGLRDATTHIVTYPQYWGLRLTGVAASDVTSLGAHTDLWNPFEQHVSSLVDRLGIVGKLVAPRACGDVLGPVLPEIAARTGLAPDTPVYCGLHDSNASLLPHLIQRRAPFTVVSTGTWVIVMSVGGRPVTLDPAKDTLVNVNAFGKPVPSARFMGGREFDLLTQGAYVAPTEDDIAAVLSSGVMVLPAVVPEIGPFVGRQARWVGGEPAIGTAERAVCTGLYLALVTARCLDLVGHQGDVIVEGPFASNTVFCAMLATAVRCPVEISLSATGTSQGAAMLVGMDKQAADHRAGDRFSPDEGSAPMANYARQWNEAVDALDPDAANGALL